MVIMRFIKNRAFYLLLTGVGIILFSSLAISAQNSRLVYLPVVQAPEQQEMEEVRGIWVTRFDWTNYASADPAKVDEVVDNVAQAGFNVIFFQVRGVADAYYTPGLEPWARRLTGTLGEDPGWDPLARLIDRAHERDIQVHAYLNVYPVWTGCDVPPEDTIPRHLYYDLLEQHGETEGKPHGLQWNTEGEVVCAVYQRVTPASIYADTHILAIVKDLIQRFDIDGVHLDHIRYDGKNSSCDPVSEERYGEECFASEAYGDWQRQQINGTVSKLYEEVKILKPELWLTAAVWPIYRDEWGWGVNSGFDSYYQDSRAWMADGVIDAISPMIYTGNPDCSKPYFWTRERWQILVEEFQTNNFGRFVIPGIGVNYCTDDDFAEIEARIEMARSIGTAGHAIFSYKSLLDKGYFDDLAAGPYLLPAEVPDVPWH